METASKCVFIYRGDEYMKKPFALQFMEVLDKRIQLYRRGKRYLQSQKDGYIGEVDMQNIVLANVPDSWTLITDKYFELDYCRGQVDAILVTPNGLKLFEVKNLSAYYEYQDDRWTTNGVELTHDYFDQMKSSRKLIRLLMQKLDTPVPVDGKLILINENDTAKIHGDMTELYLKRWHLKSYFQHLRHNQKGTIINTAEVVNLIENYSSAPPLPSIKPWEIGNSIYRGIVCRHCHHHGVNAVKLRYHVVCEQCHFKEMKELAVLRTICDIGILFYDFPLTKRFIVECINDWALNGVIKNVLHKYFHYENSNKQLNYLNPLQEIQYAFPQAIQNTRYKNSFIKL